jgi:hypothetical protein
MPYTTVLIPDESMLVYSEKTLDDKFKPDATWQEQGKEVITKGELKHGRLKIITTYSVCGAYGAIKIPLLIYAKANRVKAIQGLIGENNSHVLHDISSLGDSYDDVKKFYKCEACNGYVEGLPEEKPEGLRENFADDIDYHCQRCGTLLTKRSIVV